MANFFKNKYLSITLICFLFGICFVMAIKAYASINSTPEDNQNKNLLTAIENLEAENATLEKQIKDFE